MRIDSNGTRRIPALTGKAKRPVKAGPAHWELPRTDSLAALLAETRKTNSLLARLASMIGQFLEGYGE